MIKVLRDLFCVKKRVSGREEMVLPSVLRWSTDFAAMLRFGRVQVRLMLTMSVYYKRDVFYPYGYKRYERGSTAAIRPQAGRVLYDRLIRRLAILYYPSPLFPLLKPSVQRSI